MGRWPSLVVFLLLAFAAGAAGSLARPDAWYAALAKPAFNPPSAIFAPVWTTLFVLMAIAACRVYVRAGFGVPLALWGAQLVVNALWSPLFFGAHAIGLALLDVVVLLALVLATMLAFWRCDRIAGALLVPYVAWVGFATLLTATILRLN